MVVLTVLILQSGGARGPEGGGLRLVPLRPLRGHLPLKGEDIVVLTVLPLQGSPTRTSAQRARERLFFADGRAVVPTSSVRLDQVVRSVSVSEQSDESGTDLSIRRPPSLSMPRPDSRPGTKRQPSNPANHCPTASGPHRGSRGTYGVVPRPEGSGEDGVLPGKQGVFGGRSPPLMHEQSAWRRPQPRTQSAVGGAHNLCGLETAQGEVPSSARRRGPLTPDA